MLQIFLPLIFLAKFFLQTDDLEIPKRDINETLGKQKGTFAVAFADLGNGQQILINEGETFHAASTMKTAVLIEAYKQAAQGRISLSDSIPVKNDFQSIVDGSHYSLDAANDGDPEIYRSIGHRATVYDLLYRMIIRSSNLATNMVIELVGAGRVTQTLRELGASDMQVRRGVEDAKAYQKGLNNTTTARDLMILFSKLAEGRAVSAGASEAMIKILLDQKFNEMIPAMLPRNVLVAHKTGSISGVQHDSGIVILPDGRRYVLVLLSKDLQDEKAAIKAMAGVSEKIYKHMTKKRI